MLHGFQPSQPISVTEIGPANGATLLSDILKMRGDAAAALSWAKMGFTSETHAAAHYRTRRRR